MAFTSQKKICACVAPVSLRVQPNRVSPIFASPTSFAILRSTVLPKPMPSSSLARTRSYVNPSTLPSAHCSKLNRPLVRWPSHPKRSLPLQVEIDAIMKLRVFSFVLAVCATLAVPHVARATNLQVTRATLKNGMQVVVVNDPLAPVVTTMLNYKIGSDDQPIDGLAHATEHMMFRGSKTISSSVLMDSIDVTGGDFDADTQNEITQYFFTVPSQYLDIALRLERSRATGLLMSQPLWEQERGAITQEVTRDNSDAGYRLSVKMQDVLLKGTPYAKNGLGTVHGFAHQVNSPQLLDFYHAWYHPNNAVYVIVGDVDGPSTVARVKALFGDI